MSRITNVKVAMPDVPVRVRSARGKPAPSSQFARRCKTCGADFLGLAAGKTGERGLWDEQGWYCSVECAPDNADNEPNHITAGQREKE